MIDPSIWVVDPVTNEEVLIHYSDLEEDARERLFARPLGGFIFPANLFTLRRLPENPFYLKGWLPKRGKAMLYGVAKGGKSYICLQLARCIGCGEPFLGVPTTQGVVLYVQFELGEEILQYRMREDTKKDYTNVFVGTTFSMKLDTKGGQEQLWTALEAVEPNVLILDPKIKMISGDENESTDMRVVCDFLDSVIEGFDCSVFIIDHAGKDASKKSRGSSIWEGWVDSYIELKKVSKKGEPLRIKLQPISLRHSSLPPEPIEAVLGDDFEFRVVSGAKTVKQQVEDFVRDATFGEVTPAMVFAKKIGTNTSVYGALRELVAEGKVEKLGKGVYRWTGK